MLEIRGREARGGTMKKKKKQQPPRGRGLARSSNALVAGAKFTLITGKACMRERCSARVPTVDAGRSNSHSVRFPPIAGLTLLLAEAGGAWGTRDLHRAPSTSRTVRPGRASAALALPAPQGRRLRGRTGRPPAAALTSVSWQAACYRG